MPVSRLKQLAVGLVSLCALIGALLSLSAPALAAGPLTPETTPAAVVSNTTAVLQGVVNLEQGEAAGWYFTYKPGAAGCSGGSATHLQPELSRGSESVQQEVVGLQPGTQYSFCLIARNSAGETSSGSSLTFMTSTAAPRIDDEHGAEAGQTSFELVAQLNSHATSGSYHFEYGTTTAYGASTSQQELIALPSDVPATALLSGLQPDTVYHARVLADSAFGEATGADFTFRTLPSGGSALPDDRVYELVSPPSDDDADVYATEDPYNIDGFDNASTEPFQSALNGNAVTYPTEPVSGGNGSGGSGGNVGNQQLATRTASGWTQETIAPQGSNHSYYEVFSPDLSIGILRAGNGYQETTALLPETQALTGGYHVLYARENLARSIHGLFTSFTQPEPPSIYSFKPEFVGGSTDFSTMVFDANAALTAGAPAESRDVYQSRQGRLTLLNLLPDGSVEPEAQAGAPEEAAGEGAGSPEFSHAVSADGSRVFWTGLGAHPGLYMRENATSTVQLDASQAGGSGGGGHFWTASSDGSVAFFTDDAGAGLTGETVPGSGTNLYEYELASHTLVDLTPAAHADVQGVIGASEDGSYVYFVANGALAEGATAGECSPEYLGAPLDSRCNLYVWHAGAIRFVAQLTQQDGLDVHPYPRDNGGLNYGDWVQGLGNRTAEVAADGAAVFISELSLTGYRNEGLGEVYDFQPEGNDGAGELVCASCDPSGEPAPPKLSEGAMLLTVSNNRARATRLISADGGRVFFDSPVPLLPQDTNGRLDVYEWERDGSGSCELAQGCLSLLSGGKSDSNSYLMDTSAGGDDVFMVTRARLLEADGNETFDVYDARIDGAAPPPTTSCSGAGCQGVPPVPPIFATPSSVTFEGVGNFAPPPKVAAKKAKAKPSTRAEKLAKALSACRKRSRAKRPACDRQARKRYAVKSSVKRSAKGRK